MLQSIHRAARSLKIKELEPISKNVPIMITSPKQKVVITKKTLSDQEHVYSRANADATLTAAKELSDRAFKLYMRMNLHLEKYMYALSPAAIKDAIGMSEGKYHEAVKELINTGYLVLVPGRKNLYTFYEYPQVDCVGDVASGVNEATTDQPDNTEDLGANSADQFPDMERSSAENEEMTGQIQPVLPTDPGIEIQQDTTRDTTEDIPENIPEDIIREAMESIPFPDFQSGKSDFDQWNKEQELERKRREYRALVDSVDPEDRHYYDHMNPDRNVSYGQMDMPIDWDDPDLPF